MSIKINVEKNKTLILAISGGPDSVFLAKKVLELKKSHNLKIIIAHLNHSLRKEKSDGDENFVKNLAKKAKITFESKKIDIKNFAKKNKLNLEEAGRIKRYEFFEELRKKHKADFVVTAHHKNDLIESAFLNLIRGCSLKGVKPMEEKTIICINNEKIPILRPLIKITKNEILHFLKNNKISYRIDATNKDNSFKRNLLRNKIIPLIKEINPNFENTFTNTLETFKEAANFIEGKKTEWMKKNIKKNLFEINEFNEQNDYLKKDILISLYESLYEEKTKMDKNGLEEIIKTIKHGKTGTKKEFGEKYFLNISYKKAQILKKEEKKEIIEKRLKINKKNIYEYGVIECKTLKNSSHTNFLKKSKNEIYIKHIENIYIRSFQNGDKIKPLGLNGTKKLQDIFTDLKIQQNERLKIPILFSKNSNEIISIGNFVISENFKITDKTKNILKINIKKI